MWLKVGSPGGNWVGYNGPEVVFWDLKHSIGERQAEEEEG